MRHEPIPTQYHHLQMIDIRKHFIERKKNRQFECRYCRGIYRLERGGYEGMIEHVWRMHAYEIDRSDIYRSCERVYRVAPKYIRQYDHLNIVSDEWLDRLAMKEYQIEAISKNLFEVFKNNYKEYAYHVIQYSKQLWLKKKEVVEFMDTLPLHLLPSQVKALIRDKYQLKSGAANVLLQDNYWAYQPLGQVIAKMEQNGNHVYTYYEGATIPVILYTSQTMLENYHAYGEYVNVDYHFIPLKRAKNCWHYSIGLFYGHNTHNSGVLFAMAVINGQVSVHYEASIRLFFRAIKAVPKVVITNESKQMEKAMNNLLKEFQFIHMINWHYVLQRVRKEMEGLLESEDLCQLCADAMSALTPNQHHHVITTIKHHFHDYHFNDFQRWRSKCCMSEIQPTFVGFAVEESGVTQVGALVREHFSDYQSGLGVFFMDAIQFERVFPTLDTHEPVLFGRQHICRYAEETKDLLRVRQVLEKPIFQKLLYLYQKSQDKAEINCVDDHGLYYCIQHRSASDVLSYRVWYDLSADCWRCECGLLYWSGLPCSHLIKLIRHCRGSLMYYISSRWLLQGQHLDDSVEQTSQNSQLSL